MMEIAASIAALANSQRSFGLGFAIDSCGEHYPSVLSGQSGPSVFRE
jgi:hypothetical protein